MRKLSEYRSQLGLRGRGMIGGPPAFFASAVLLRSTTQRTRPQGSIAGRHRRPGEDLPQVPADATAWRSSIMRCGPNRANATECQAS